ncbi:MAG: DUF748 domain-containing protein [Gammaproteobacteria bacterium]
MSLSFLSTRWFRISIVAATLIAVFLVGTPVLIKHFARQWLLEHGGGEVRFRDVDFNPFSGSLLLKELDVKVDRETTLSFASAGLDLAWLPLFRKQIKVQSVELAGFHVVVDNRDVLRVGGILLPAAADAEADEEPASSPWLSGIESLTLRDFRLVYRDPKIETEVTLKRLRLSGLAQWAPDRAAHLELAGSVNGAPVALDAELAPLADTADYRGTLSVRGLSLGRFAPLAQPQLDALGGSASLESAFSIRQTGSDLTLSHNGSLELSGLELVSGDLKLAGQNAEWDGELGVSQSTEALDVTHSGGVEVAELRLVMEALQLASHSGNWSGELSLRRSSDAMSVSHRGGLAVEQLKLVSDAGVVENQSTRWDGTTDLQLAGADPQLTINTDGALVVGASRADLQQPPLYAEQERLSHQGRFSLAPGDAGPKLELSTNIELHKLRLEAEERRFRLLDVQDLRLNEVQMAALNRLAIQSVQIDELYLGQSTADSDNAEQQDAFLHISQTRMSKPSYADNLLSIDSIEYQGWRARIHRNKEGQWTLVRLFDVIERMAAGPEPSGEADAPAGGEESPDPAGATQPLQYAVKRIEAAAGSRLSFLDESVDPVFETELEFDALRLENIDSRQPQQPVHLVVDGRMGKYTRLAMQGDLRPFLQPPGLDLKGSIEAMDLPQLSSYTRESLGVVLNSGTLDADLTMQTKTDALDGKAALELHQLKLKSVPGEDTLQSNIPMPLDTALDALRDKNNTIDLEIPVAGNINDPEFNINDAITQALAKGVKKGALGYLTLALQPYGTLITAARYAGEAATRVRLNPVGFEPGQSALDGSDRDYLAKVAGVLKDRPKIAVKLCGVAAPPDRLFFQQQQQKEQQRKQKAEKTPKAPAQAQEAPPVEAIVVDEATLSGLAKQRAAAVKDFLIQKHGVSASRLVGCLPQLEIDDEKAEPRVDLLI